RRRARLCRRPRRWRAGRARPLGAHHPHEPRDPARARADGTRPLRPQVPRRAVRLRRHVARDRVRLLRLHALGLRALRLLAAALLRRAVGHGAPGVARRPAPRRPGLLQRPRPRRDVHRRRSLHPRAAHRRQRRDRLAVRLVRRRLRRRPPHRLGVPWQPPEPLFRAFVMDRPILYSLVERVRAEERLQQFAAALPTRARVSEPILPRVLAALHDELGRGLVVAVPEDADARDVAEAAGWFLGEEQVALFPSRGVHWGSGLEPPPHLVGERARALAVLERGGLVCASAAALAEGIPPASARPATLTLERGAEPGLDALAEQLADAGYDRVERVEERGQFAVRGGLVDVFPTTGREPLRIELFGDEIEQIRAFSPFTQRALREVDGATIYPATERRRELEEIVLPDDEEPVAV